MRRKGFTLIEMVVVLAVVSILVAILVPTIAKHIKDAKITRTQNEEQVILAAMMSLYKDVGRWPYTNLDGPAGGVNRVLSGTSTDPVPGGSNWGTWDPHKQLYDFLYFNNPDNDTGPINFNQAGQDYATSGEYAWRGPYIDKMSYVDPWGNQYVISARYFPGNPGVVTTGHQVLLMSAGPDSTWNTPFSDAVTRLTIPNDSPVDDDIGMVVYTNN